MYRGPYNCFSNVDKRHDTVLVDEHDIQLRILEQNVDRGESLVNSASKSAIHYYLTSESSQVLQTFLEICGVLTIIFLNDCAFGAIIVYYIRLHTVKIANYEVRANTWVGAV